VKIRSGGRSQVLWLELGTFGILELEEGFQNMFESNKNDALGSAIIILVLLLSPPHSFAYRPNPVYTFCMFLFIPFYFSFWSTMV